jgi:hypothetical protein
MFIPGFLVSMVTFPGVIVHEIAHQFFCRVTGTPVLDVCYFRIGNPAGYVVHDQPASPGKHLLVSIAPFFVNTLVGAVIGAPSAISSFTFDHADLLDIVLIWLGVSIAMHSFPSTGDARSLWSALDQEPWWLKTLIAPIVGIIFLGAILSFVWVDVIYGVVVAALLPKLLIFWLA